MLDDCVVRVHAPVGHPVSMVSQMNMPLSFVFFEIGKQSLTSCELFFFVCACARIEGELPVFAGCRWGCGIPQRRLARGLIGFWEETAGRKGPT